ncbi:MAG TPA: hypothetical protein VGD02_02815 [Gemmatimonadaceae bacterium]|jgi:hypothetical protein
MNRKLPGACAFAVLTFFALACGRSSRDRARADTALTSEEADMNSPIPTDTLSISGKKKATCLPTGLWALCSVEKRLTQSGFVVRKNDSAPPARNGFSIQPTVYTLGHSRLEVFLYPSAAAVARDVAKLDTVRIAPVGRANTWEGTPTFVRSANVLAVFMTDNPQSAERVSLALTAGAPQPASVPRLRPIVSTPSSH